MDILTTIAGVAGISAALIAAIQFFGIQDVRAFFRQRPKKTNLEKNNIDFHSRFSLDNIILLTSELNKRDALKKISHHAAKICDVKWNDVYHALLQREALGNTGIGDGIGAPHAQIPNLDSAYLFVAKICPPLEYAASDAKPVDLMFIFLLPENGGRLGSMIGISRLKDPVIAEKIRRETSKRGVFEIISLELIKLKL